MLSSMLSYSAVLLSSNVIFYFQSFLVNLNRRYLRTPHHTLLCDAQNEQRQRISRQNGLSPQDVDRNCICPPDQGVNKPLPEIPPMPQTGHEVPLEGVTIGGQGQAWDGRGMSPAQVNAYNGQTSTPYNAQAQGGNAYNAQGARTEMGDEIEDAPPPYSEPAGGVEGLRGPEPAVIRPIRVEQDPAGNAVVWRECDGRQAAPEVSRSGGLSRWAA